MQITPEQIRAARVVVGLGVRELAEQAGMTPFTVTRFETGKGRMHPNNLAKVRTVLEQAGVTFLPDDGSGYGIRWRKPEGSP